MALTGIKSNKDSKVQKARNQQRQVCTAQGKERARIWAENRHLRCIPLVFAHKVSDNLQNVTGERSEVSTSGSQGVTNPEQILQNLESRHQELLKEAAEIQSAIQVIRLTFQNETVFQERTGSYSTRC